MQTSPFRQRYLQISLKQIQLTHELCRSNLIDAITYLQKWKFIWFSDSVDLMKIRAKSKGVIQLGTVDMEGPVRRILL